MNIARLLHDAARFAPDETALFKGQSPALSFSDLAGRAARLAGFLKASAVAPGDRVALFMTNHLAYLETLYGVFHSGAVAVPVNAKLHARELAYILEESGAVFCFINNDTATVGEQAAGLMGRNIRLLNVDDGRAYAKALATDAIAMFPGEGDDVAWLFFTSGTTGRSKGAMLTHNNLFLMAASYLTEVDEVARGDILLHAAPLSHGSGMYNFAHIARGAGQMIPESRGFDTAEITAMAARPGRLSMFAAPTMIHRLIAHLPKDMALPGLKLLVYGGGPMLVEQALEALSRLGPRLAQIYGQGECPMTITRLPQYEHLQTVDDGLFKRRLSSVGRPFNLVDIRIGDADAPLGAGEAGEILVKSPIVMKGYWSRGKGKTEIKPGSWLKTGDIGYFDEEGYLHLSDRSKDVIISGGSNIYSREIEDVLIRHPGVEEVAVIGRPSPEWGEEVVAVIGHGSGAPPAIEQLDQLCRDFIAAFKRPRHYLFLKELPKNAYGKIEKKLLKEMDGHKPL